MKRTIMFCQILLLALSGFAQKMDKKTRYQELSGCYGKSTEGICLFEDGKFLLYGYATAVFGTYVFEKDYLLFYPDKEELFEVYAHQNKSIGANSRIDFKGFDRAQDTYLQLGTGPVKPVFNKDANCFDGPFVLTHKNKVSGITLSDKNNSWLYLIDEKFNDLTLIYNRPGEYTKHFSGMISTHESIQNGGKKLSDGPLLKLSDFFGEPGVRKQKTDKNQGQWQDILQLKNEYELPKKNSGDFIFANQHYHVFPEPPAGDYRYDQATNQYISKKAKENELYHQQNQYNDPRYLRKYVKLLPKTKGNFTGIKDSVSASPLFYTVCGDDTGKSYHYEGYQKYEEDDAPAAVPTKILPVPMPPVNKTDGK